MAKPPEENKLNDGDDLFKLPESQPQSERRKKIADSDEFSPWLKNSHTVFISVLTWIIALPVNAAILIDKTHFFKTMIKGELVNDLILYNMIFQFFFLAAIFFYYSKRDKKLLLHTNRVGIYIDRLKSPNEREPSSAVLYKNARINSLSFHWYWRAFWGLLFFLYLVFALEQLFKQQLSLNVWLSIGINCFETLLNNLGGVMIFMCFSLVLNPVKWFENDDVKKVKILEDRYYMRSIYRTLLVIVTMITIIHFALMAYNIHIGPEGDYKGIDTFFKMFSGLLNAVAIALLIARLDSKFINIKTRLIGILYFYAASQTLFGFFNDNDPIKIFVLYLVLFLKVHFFLIISYAITTNRLTDHFLIFPYIKDLVEKEAWGKAED